VTKITLTVEDPPFCEGKLEVTAAFDLDNIPEAAQGNVLGTALNGVVSLFVEEWGNTVRAGEVDEDDDTE